MKHLIIGAGNMGKRHGAILEGLGDTVDYVDIDWKPNIYKVHPYDSALICTPPQLHEFYLKFLADTKIPVFCEKPVVTEITEFSYPALSMVACNWRWCTCFDIENDVYLCTGYPGLKTPTGYLDLIHFLDLFWEKYGKPDDGQLVFVDWAMALCVKKGNKTLEANLLTNQNTPIYAIKMGFKEDGFFHYPDKPLPCQMFVKQMATWRRCLKGLENSPNPLNMALERTKWLIMLKNEKSSYKSKLSDLERIGLGSVEGI